MKTCDELATGVCYTEKKFCEKYRYYYERDKHSNNRNETS